MINSISVYGNLLRNMQINNKVSSLATERLSTGKRINHASDSPSDILRISRLNSKIRGTDVAGRNIQDGISLIQTTESALNGVQNIGQRLKELSVSYKNDSLSDDDKKAIEDEGRELLKEMQNIQDNTEFNGQKVFNKGKFSIQTGSDAISSYDIKVQGLNISNGSIIIPSQNNTSTTTNTNTSNTESAKGTTSNNNNNNSTTTTKTTTVTTVPTGINGFVEWKNTSGNLVYVGNVKDGVYDGYGTLYDGKGNMKYQGNFANGEFDGYGKIYGDNGNVVYTGSTSNGVCNGYGNLYNDQGDKIYEGNFENGVYSGFGVETSSNGYVYEGNFKNGLKNDDGKLSDQCKNVLYQGTWVDDKPIDSRPIDGYTPKTSSDVKPVVFHNTSSKSLSDVPTTNSAVTSTTSVTTTTEKSNSTGTNSSTSTGKENSTTTTTTNCGNTGGTTTSPTSSLDISTILKDDNIDKYVLSPIRQAISSLGIQEEILNSRYELSQSQNQIRENYLSKIEDVDMAKEILKKAKADMLLQTSMSLFSNGLDQDRNYIAMLLR